MKKRQVAWILVIAVILSLGLPVLGSGTAQDSVISLSYLNNTIKPELASAVSARIAQMIEDPDSVQARGESAVSSISQEGAMEDVARRVLEKLQMQGLYLYSTSGRRTVTLKKDDVVSGLTGTTVLLRSGSASVINNPIINLARGEQSAAGSAVAQNTNYMLPTSDGAGIRITSNTAEVMVDGVYRIVSLRYRAQYFDLADALKAMDLFRGSNIGYELSRGATRTEALVMLLRLLGEEEEALAYTGTHPFNDVDAWAAPYVAYAYSKGYTRGISANKFGARDLTTANHYMTFLLRALGYDDTKGDFSWDHAMEYAVTRKILSQNERSAVERSGFQRDQMVFVSYYALFANKKNEDIRLLDELIAKGVISQSVADAAIAEVERPRL